MRDAVIVARRMGHAKSYAERLFDFPQVGALDAAAATRAIAKPAEDAGVLIESDALRRIVDIAEALGRKVTALGPTRGQLIEKGVIWSPGHGDTAFTVPLSYEFTRRVIPGDDWRM